MGAWFGVGVWLVVLLVLLCFLGGVDLFGFWFWWLILLCGALGFIVLRWGGVFGATLGLGLGDFGFGWF